MLKTHKITVTTTGGAGVATGTATSDNPIIGELVGIYLDYVSQPGTCDVTVATAGTPSTTILTVTNGNTDGWFYPRHGVVNASNSAITDSNAPFIIADKITVSIAQGDAASLIAYIQVQ